ncbi:MAG: helix-turn-helix transcriptional regulator [Rhodospirillales bacterium]
MSKRGTNPPPHPVDRHHAARLRRLRRQRGLSGEDLEARIGWPAGMIDGFESGEKTIKAEHLLLLSETFGISVSLLFDGLPDLHGGDGKAAANAGTSPIRLIPGRGGC